MTEKPTMYYEDLEILINYTYEKVGDNKWKATIHEYPGISIDIEHDYHPSETQGYVEEVVKEKMEELIRELLLKESNRRSEEEQTK